ncbi:MAG: Uma2 family endonuclease [Chloroflexi bacterium]|nr:Uma2 family endonuclease [Chloroflexota bacterium]
MLSLYRTARATSSPAALIETYLAGTNGLCHTLQIERDGTVSTASDREPDTEQHAATWGEAEEERCRLEGRRRLIEQLGIEPRVVDGDAAMLLSDNEDQTDEPSMSADATFAREVRAVVGRSTPDRLRLYGDEAPDAVATAQRIIASMAFREAVAHPTCRRDVSLLAVVDGTVLDLTADLVYDTEEGVVLVAFDFADPAMGDGGRQRTLAARLEVADSIEVADSTVAFDLGQKADLYARYGVPGLWVLDLPADRVVIHREPTADGYASVEEPRRGASVSPLAFADVGFAIDELLGTPQAADSAADDDDADDEDADDENVDDEGADRE